MRVVGAGYPRTATTSLSLALPRLIGEPCYHMSEVFGRPDDVPVWQRAVDGELPDRAGWDALLGEFGAAVDWPASYFWRELSEAYPDALILLSVRRDAAAWWRSADQTVWEAARQAPGNEEWAPSKEWYRLMVSLLRAEFGRHWDDGEVTQRAYEAHIADVRANAPADRLLVWSADQGWEPICAALGVPVPDEPFPRANTSEEWFARSHR